MRNLTIMKLPTWKFLIKSKYSSEILKCSNLSWKNEKTSKNLSSDNTKLSLANLLNNQLFILLKRIITILLCDNPL